MVFSLSFRNTSYTDRLYHSNVICYFKKYKHHYVREKLQDFGFLSNVKKNHGFCTCYEFAWILTNEDYSGICLTEEEYIDIAYNCGYLYDEKETGYRYTLGENENITFIDLNVEALLKEYHPDLYQQLYGWTKTPKEGRMYYALLGYCYPPSPKPTSKYFNQCLNNALTKVFDNIEPFEPCSLTEVIDEMPKNTSAAFSGIRRFGKRRKKDVMLSEIIEDYETMRTRIHKGLEYENYTMFAMRGHLSDIEKHKTRAIWMVPGEQILMEMRFFRPVYLQLENDFFRKRVIHGKGALRRLREYLYDNMNHHFCNTDISGWDSFRSVWLNELIFIKLREKIHFKNEAEKLEYNYITRNSNVYARTIFPSGKVYRTNGGLLSGSAGTLMINTLLNMVLTYTALEMMKMEEGIDYIETSWLGDDFSIKTPIPFDLETYKRLLLKNFSLVVKPEKCFISRPEEDRKFLGYELKGGLLFKNTEDLFAGILYTESYFKRDFNSIANSFTRIFSYFILGGCNNYDFMDFFYLFLGKYGAWLDKVEYIFDDRKLRISRVLKDIFNVAIGKFNSESFKNMNKELAKYILLYDYDFINVNKELI